MVNPMISTLISIVFLGGIYGLMTSGLSLIYGVMKIVNFAHGDFIMIGMYITFWICYLYGLDPYLTLIIVIPLMMILGFILEKSVINKTIGKGDEKQVFLTLGLSLVLENIALILWKGDYRTVSYRPTSININGLYIDIPRLYGFIGSLIIISFLYLFLKRTYIGKALRATAQNREAALLMGININNIYMIAFGIGSVLAGVAGTFLIVFYYTYPTVGFYLGLLCFVVMVFGGIGNVFGSAVAGYVIAFIEQLSSIYISPGLKEAFLFGFFILILLIRPTGLFGERMS